MDVTGDIPPDALKVVGQRKPRIDAKERVTGRAVYPADFVLPGMLHGKIKRSPHAHARIRRIDTSKVLKLAGVRAVATAADLPNAPPGTMAPVGGAGADVWYLSRLNFAREKVFWVGHPVAAVAAIDTHVAEAALALIEVDYEVLTPVMSIADAMRPGAPILHDHCITKGVEPPSTAPSNVGSRSLVTRGDVARGFAESDEIVEVSVTVDMAHQGYIEPNATVANVEPGGMTTVWASTQGAFTLEVQLSTILGKPQTQVKVVPLEVGGGFGGKIYGHVEVAAAVLSQKSGRPVKVVINREEVMLGTGPAQGAEIKVKLGAKKSGALMAIEAHFLFDAGGFPGLAFALPMQAGVNPYQCPNLLLEGYDVLTTKPRAEAYRGPGGPQVAFAIEQAIDEMALRLGLDPVKFRHQNASVTGSPMAAGTPFPPIALKEMLERVSKHSSWTDPLPKGRHPRGRGVAIGYWRGTSMTSACHISLTGDAKLMVTMGAVDISGTRTTIGQVAAEEFGLDSGDVYVQHGDTKSVGFTNVSAGSRIARTMTAAVHTACQDALQQLKKRAAQQLQCGVEDVVYVDREFRVNRAGGGSIPLKTLAKNSIAEGAIVAHGVSTDLALGVELGAHVCDVEVDPATGQVTILRYTCFQDVGRALNPMAVEGQMEGSAAQGLGWALTEGYDFDSKGRLRNANLLDYRIPTFLDLPKIDCVILESPVPGVPYGVRGVGEVPILPPGPAVANAIKRATGKRPTTMPMTPERIVRLLRGGSFGKV